MSDDFMTTLSPGGNPSRVEFLTLSNVQSRSGQSFRTDPLTGVHVFSKWFCPIEGLIDLTAEMDLNRVDRYSQVPLW